MGSASAARLAAQGWSLIMCDLDAGRLEQTAAPLRQSAGQVEILAGNIADAAFPNRLIGLLASAPIGAVIHTAGLSPTMGDAAQIFAVNYDATARLLEVVRPRMAEGACAVLIASSSGYSAISPETDAALDAIGPDADSSSLLKIASDSGACLCSVQAGRAAAGRAAGDGLWRAQGADHVDFPGTDRHCDGTRRSEGSPIMEKMRLNTPLGRYGTADEIASVAVFLCSPEASFVTGSDIKVDGGVLAVMR
jgi:NAD(P)-dependent dehydrogenase (short-subunit alcohol dehydrogenase family)